MDREFMKKFYKTKEDPYHIATEGDEEYRQEIEKFGEMEKEFCITVGGMESEIYKKYEECMDQFMSAMNVLVMDAYLLGAEDREKMLR